ncbi:MAG: hypothetical protein J5562_05755 [Clostridia bacterium]|nr:hypothetical protein [Clostridia bacterium]
MRKALILFVTIIMIFGIGLTSASATVYRPGNNSGYVSAGAASVFRPFNNSSSIGSKSASVFRPLSVSSYESPKSARVFRPYYITEITEKLSGEMTYGISISYDLSAYADEVYIASESLLYENDNGKHVYHQKVHGNMNVLNSTVTTRAAAEALGYEPCKTCAQ